MVSRILICALLGIAVFTFLYFVEIKLRKSATEPDVQGSLDQGPNP